MATIKIYAHWPLASMRRATRIKITNGKWPKRTYGGDTMVPRWLRSRWLRLRSATGNEASGVEASGGHSKITTRDPSHTHPPFSRADMLNSVTPRWLRLRSATGDEATGVEATENEATDAGPSHSGILLIQVTPIQ